MYWWSATNVPQSRVCVCVWLLMNEKTIDFDFPALIYLLPSIKFRI